MSAQDDFENTIDFADNIISLCPNCHRKIHYADKETRRDLIKKLFLNREEIYSKYEITITLNKLFEYYNIDKSKKD
ncbi:hypothetical protein CBF31_08890 [Vagococcus fessus]|uniref:HNH domain-containing protein n=1 Tax=Vagococcus fessus TaxID=120370 RepID=A0A430A6H6_9ENTE|nr:hypothetical protein CBF31_08890 [Vagococcus fessus]